MTLETALRLGRVSNLPTVWTNVMAGMALAGATLRPSLVVLITLAVSLLYVAGMYLNDVCDAAWDAQHRPERPIPSGEVSRGTVLAVGYALLAAGFVVLAVVGGEQGALGGAVLAGLILVYDAVHKKTAVAPAIMGACRAAVYVAAALAAGATPLRARLYVGAALLLLYIVLVSVIARRESTDPRARGLVAPLIAGISLLDGTLLVLTGHPIAAALTVAAFFQTRAWQNRVPGT